MVRQIHPLTFAILGFVLGLIVFGLFLKPEVETKIVETVKIETDTIYHTIRDTVYRTEFKYLYERDTIIENYQPKIRGFKELYPFLYGNVAINGEVLGELRYMNVKTDFKLPTITNTITKEKTTTIIKKPTGIYLVGGIDSNFSYSIGGTYLRDRSLINYSYQPSVQIHSVGVGWKVF